MSRSFQKKKKGKKEKEKNQNNSRLIKCAVVDNSTTSSSSSSSRIEFNFCTVIVILDSLAALLAVQASVVLLGLGLVSSLLMKCMSVDRRNSASWSGANTTKADKNGTISVRVGEAREQRPFKSSKYAR